MFKAFYDSWLPKDQVLTEKQERALAALSVKRAKYQAHIDTYHAWQDLVLAAPNNRFFTPDNMHMTDLGKSVCPEYTWNMNMKEMKREAQRLDTASELAAEKLDQLNFYEAAIKTSEKNIDNVLIDILRT